MYNGITQVKQNKPVQELHCFTFILPLSCLVLTEANRCAHECTLYTCTSQTMQSWLPSSLTWPERYTTPPMTYWFYFWLIERKIKNEGVQMETNVRWSCDYTWTLSWLKKNNNNPLVNKTRIKRFNPTNTKCTMLQHWTGLLCVCVFTSWCLNPFPYTVMSEECALWETDSSFLLLWSSRLSPLGVTLLCSIFSCAK